MESRTSLAVAVGGVAGAGLRWALGEGLDSGSTWPWAVFVANITGCVLLGLLVGGFRSLLQTNILIGTSVGFCGALTTFSGFAVELAQFLREDRLGVFLAYMLVSVVLGVAGFVGGRVAGRELRVRGALP